MTGHHDGICIDHRKRSSTASTIPRNDPPDDSSITG
jgi:hypothetical protein